MIDEFSRNPFVETEQTLNVIDTTIFYLKRKITPPCQIILDIGRYSPLTECVGEAFPMCQIFNTDGDLDTDYDFPPFSYDYILYSHTIEHQFNPLNTLLELKRVMNYKARMFIILPQKPKFLWWDGHFHEIDDYRMRMLLKRAGLRVISYEKHRVWRDWKFYFTGVRPFIRLFCEWNGYYEVQL
jgi:SAM-dependent methyltransferase